MAMALRKMYNRPNSDCVCSCIIVLCIKLGQTWGLHWPQPWDRIGLALMVMESWHHRMDTTVPPPPLVLPHPREDGPPPPPGGPHYHHTYTFLGTEIAA